MANGNSKSTSGKGASGSRKSNSSKKRKGKGNEKTMFSMVRSKSTVASVGFILGLLFLVPVVISGGEGSPFYEVHTFLWTILGIWAFIFPVCAVVRGIVFFLGKNEGKAARVMLLVCAFALLLAGGVHIAGLSDLSKTFSEALRDVYINGMNHSESALYFSGEIGALFGSLIFYMCRVKALSIFIDLILILMLGMLAFRITPGNIVLKLRDPGSKVIHTTDNAIRTGRTFLSEKQSEWQNQRNIEKQRQLEEKQRLQEERRRAGRNTRTPNSFNDYGQIVSSGSSGYPGRNSSTGIPFSNPVKGEFGGGVDFNIILDDSVGAEIIEDESTGMFNDGLKPSDLVNDVGDKKPENNSDDNYGNETGRVIIPPVKKQPDTVAVDNIEPTDGRPKIIPMSQEEINKYAGVENPVAAKPEKPKPLTESEITDVAKSLTEGMESEQKKEYVFPPLSLLREPDRNQKYYNESELYLNGDKLIAALDSFNVSASVSAIVPGPSVTRYELTPAPGVKISKFTGLADDLALCLAAPAGIRIEAPIPNKSAIGVEIPNKEKLTITFREVIDTPEFNKAESKLTVALGKNISGEPIYCNISKMPHLLVAGTTGSGKSVLMNSMIVSLIYKSSPDDVRFILIDPKQVEFGMYNGIPHLLVPVVSDARKASGALNWGVTEMLDRYKLFNECKVRDLKGYNKLRKSDETLPNKPNIVIFIDELADLMIAAPSEVEDAIQRIAQMGRAAGVHLVVATQRPSVDVITGVIKANMSSRIALTVKTYIDSKTILDGSGAEKLTGNGDMLYAPIDFHKPLRVQGCYLSDSEIIDVVNFLKSNGEAEYDSEIADQMEKSMPVEKSKRGGDSAGASASGVSDDEKLDEVMEFIFNNPDQISISSIQRHCRLGFSRAGRIVDELEEKGIIAKVEGSKTKRLAITRNEWYEMLAVSSGGADSSPAKSEFVDSSAMYDPFMDPDKVTTVTDDDMGFS